MNRSLLGCSCLTTLVALIASGGCDPGGATQGGPVPGGGPAVGVASGTSPDGGPCDTPPDASVPKAVAVAVRWRPVDHTPGSWRFFVSELTIENTGAVPLESGGFRLYFSFIRRVLREGEGDGEGPTATLQKLSEQGVRIAKADVAQSGDYYVLEPLPSFVAIKPGEKRVVKILAENWAVLKTDAPSGFHLAVPGAASAIAVKASVDIDPNDPKQTTRFEGDVLPVETPALRYDENARLARRELSAEDGLVPTPLSVTRGTGGGDYALGAAPVKVHFARGLAGEAAYLKAALRDLLSANVDVLEADGGDAAISLRVDPHLDVTGDRAPDAEGYTLAIDARGVRIVGADAAGVFYGIQTLRQLVPASAYQAAAKPGQQVAAIPLPAITIADAPLFRYRGMALDVGRHFQSKETVKRLLDLLAHHKINKFHFHLTDDEGWRLEIPGIPELTSYGARRGFDLAEREMLHAGLGSSDDLSPGDGIERKPASETDANGGAAPAYQGFETATLNFVGRGSGFYTAKDFEEILAYAAERYIEVIPEIDMPGHARAAVKSMEARYDRYRVSDPAKATEYRLLDPNDTSLHTSVQMYTDNFVNPCVESTYAFLGKVVGEIKARYAAVPAAKLTLVHGGGDELPALGANVWWQGSPACKAAATTKDLSDLALRDHFFTRWSRIITSTGAQMAGWDDILHDGFTLPGFVAMPWSNVWGWGREDDAYKLANGGRSVILAHATNLYLDLAYTKDPDEPGYYWANFVDEKKTFEYQPFDVFANATHDRMGNPIAPAAWADKVRLAEAAKTNILGMQGLLWGENVKSPALLDYFAFPKMLGVAERAWNRNVPTPASMPAAWEKATNALGRAILPRLDAFRAVDLRDEVPDEAGVRYRIPPPGGKIAGGQLLANVRYPGMAIEYSTNAGQSWAAYVGPVPVSGAVLLRTVVGGGRVSRVAKVE